jgi:hypothetical protein
MASISARIKNSDESQVMSDEKNTARYFSAKITIAPTHS